MNVDGALPSVLLKFDKDRVATCTLRTIANVDRDCGTNLMCDPTPMTRPSAALLLSFLYHSLTRDDPKLTPEQVDAFYINHRTEYLKGCDWCWERAMNIILPEAAQKKKEMESQENGTGSKNGPSESTSSDSPTKNSGT